MILYAVEDEEGGEMSVVSLFTRNGIGVMTVKGKCSQQTDNKGPETCHQYAVYLKNYLIDLFSIIMTLFLSCPGYHYLSICLDGAIS